MKKLTLLLCILLSMSAFAQNKEKLKDISEATFYGVDFSKAKVYGASESVYDFKAAFFSINQLFITEAKKYNVAKAFKMKIVTNLQEVEQKISAINEKDIMISQDSYKLDAAEISALIKAFPTEAKEGTGLIFVAELLDKSHNRGHYQVVFFDIATKNIIDSWSVNAKAGGFGLRNFWARSVYQVLKDVKI